MNDDKITYTYCGVKARAWQDEDKLFYVESKNIHSTLLVDGDTLQFAARQFEILVDEHIKLCEDKNLQLFKPSKNEYQLQVMTAIKELTNIIRNCNQTRDRLLKLHPEMKDE